MAAPSALPTLVRATEYHRRTEQGILRRVNVKTWLGRATYARSTQAFASAGPWAKGFRRNPEATGRSANVAVGRELKWTPDFGPWVKSS